MRIEQRAERRRRTPRPSAISTPNGNPKTTSRIGRSRARALTRPPRSATALTRRTTIEEDREPEDPEQHPGRRPASRSPGAPGCEGDAASNASRARHLVVDHAPDHRPVHRHDLEVGDRPHVRRALDARPHGNLRGASLRERRLDLGRQQVVDERLRLDGVLRALDQHHAVRDEKESRGRPGPGPAISTFVGIPLELRPVGVVRVGQAEGTASLRFATSASRVRCPGEPHVVRDAAPRATRRSCPCRRARRARTTWVSAVPALGFDITPCSCTWRRRGRAPASAPGPRSRASCCRR